jgi:hypothetical protein
MRLRSQTPYWAIHCCDRDQIRDQDTKGQRRTGRDGCDVDAMASATNGDGGDGEDGLGLGSPCS